LRKNTSVYTLAILACLGTLVCWCIAPLFIKYLTGYLDLWTQNLLRYGSAVLFWLPFLVAEIKMGRVPKSVWKRALLPFLPNIVMQNMWAWAFYYIDPGFASLLSTTAFLWVIILSVIFFAEERRLLTGKRFIFSIVLSVAGLTGVMVFHPAFGKSYTTEQSGVPVMIGIAIIIIYGFIWGTYGVLVKAVFRDIDSRVGFSVVSIYTVVTIFVLTMLLGKPAMMFDMPPFGWFAAIISGITGIALGHVFYYSSIRRLGSTTPSIILLAQPFIVAILSYFIFAEALSVLQWLSGFVLIAGSALAITSEKQEVTTVI